MDSNYTIKLLLTITNTQQPVLVTTFDTISSKVSIDTGEANDSFRVTIITFRVFILYIIPIVTDYDSVKCIRYNLNESSPSQTLQPLVGLGLFHRFSGGFVAVHFSGVGSSAQRPTPSLEDQDYNSSGP
jgi:hypothetical protein